MLVAKLIAVAVELNVTVLLPRLIVRVLLLLDDRDAAVTLKLLVVKVPDVMVSVALLIFNASLSDMEPVFLLKDKGVFITLPLVVIVATDDVENVTVPDTVNPADGSRIKL